MLVLSQACQDTRPDKTCQRRYQIYEGLSTPKHSKCFLASADVLRVMVDMEMTQLLPSFARL